MNDADHITEAAEGCVTTVHDLLISTVPRHYWFRPRPVVVGLKSAFSVASSPLQLTDLCQRFRAIVDCGPDLSLRAWSGRFHRL